MSVALERHWRLIMGDYRKEPEPRKQNAETKPVFQGKGRSGN